MLKQLVYGDVKTGVDMVISQVARLSRRLLGDCRLFGGACRSDRSEAASGS